MKKKILALTLSLALMLSVAPVGTIAPSVEVDSTMAMMVAESEEGQQTAASNEMGEQQSDGTEGSEEAIPDGSQDAVTDPAAEEPSVAEVSEEHPDESNPDAPEVIPECTCGTEDGVHAEDCPLYVKPEAFDPAEVYVKIQEMSDEELDTYLASLQEEELEALLAYAATLETVELPQTVDYPYAGPFFGAVNVGPARRMRMLAAARSLAGVDSDGVVTTKTATKNEDGSYLLRLEAYVTGATTTITTDKTVPVDIVVVLDQSGSMAHDFNGNTTRNNASRRQYAMKNAMNSFIDTVSAKYTTDADHRISIVTFGSGASTLQGWTAVDAAGATSLHNKINGLPNVPEGATNIGAGMQVAQTLMGSGYNYSGGSTQRYKVVIVFTDGIPTTRTDFETGVANTALAASQNLKNSGATVYTIGIFNGADPLQLHGDKWEYALHRDIPCSGQPGSYWGGSLASSWFGNNDFDSLDVPAGNRFLNYLSSNCPSASSIGITRGEYNPGNYWLGSGTGFRIDYNAGKSYDGYYLTASNSASIDSIFHTISEQIQTGGASITLDSSTVIQDVISDYFRLPEGSGAESVIVKTADCNAFNGDTPSWTNEHAVSLTPTLSGSSLTVSGFDFSENYVGKDTTTGVVHPGKKLILEIPVEPKAGFLGGNGVPTNGNESGIYSAGGVVENFAVPTVDVEIPEIEISITAEDKNVYLMASLTDAQLKEGATVTANSADLLDLSALAEWQKAFVDVAVTSDAQTNLTADRTYTLTASITPTATGTANAKTNSSTANIHVFLPTLTYKDTQVFYGGAVPNDYSANLVTTEWKHGDTVDTSVTMLGTAPVLGQNCTPVNSSDLANGKIATKKDIPVTAAVMIGQTDVTSYAIFAHQDCQSGENLKNGRFLLHVDTGTLTIAKAGGASDEPYVFTVLKDGAKYTEVSITGNGTATVYELPAGTYTIQEDTGWSWRYGSSVSGAVTLSATSTAGTISCTNARQKESILNGYSPVVKNVSGASANN